MEEIALDELIVSVKEDINKFYEVDGNGAGGSLHIMLDDGNMQDNDILFCINNAISKSDWDGLIIAAKFMKIPLHRREKEFAG